MTLSYYSSIPTIIVATALTIFVVYLISDIVKDNNRAIVLKAAAFSIMIAHFSLQFFIILVENIPLDMFQPVNLYPAYSGIARRAVYALVCVYSVCSAGFNLSGFLRVLLSTFGVLLGYPDIFVNALDYFSVMNVML